MRARVTEVLARLLFVFAALVGTAASVQKQQPWPHAPEELRDGRIEPEGLVTGVGVDAVPNGTGWMVTLTNRTESALVVFWEDWRYESAYGERLGRLQCGGGERLAAELAPSATWSGPCLPEPHPDKRPPGHSGIDDRVVLEVGLGGEKRAWTGRIRYPATSTPSSGGTGGSSGGTGGCVKGKPCGNSCIASWKTCRK